MFKKIMNKKLLKNQKGLTLIELLAVIVILAIVAAIAIPAIGNIIENSRYNAAKADSINVINAANLYFTDERSEIDDKVTVGKLKEEKYLDNLGTFEKVKDAATVVKTAEGNKLTAENVKYSGSKTVTFTNASIEEINDDKQKGSKDSVTSIGK
ncbi:prepilin-type N-terminal cleavage/methylation domain-containing protein [Lysinibacillus xylanilyticus]|uniref:prepilin-type N-terminal cleavage/methylation domain-containing protein n=1 Tax=Lysinibacillus xylanilyticus TaxID=582475 RepID=UPI002B244EE4|nr:prepilin-type N-terminal cleavage/methylation domain-containing protein [Lysinibacillus xylanilyticus]MEB2302758.1 prepilin-type N-terminal cleavage/methylation domain-containing protein [Lysinibacillus xylanilyticus]